MAFADHHRLDRNYFLLMVALIWLGILMGFVPEIVGRFDDHSFGKAPSDPSSLSIQLAGLRGAGRRAIALRKSPDTHKRLMILATTSVHRLPKSRYVRTDH